LNEPRYLFYEAARDLVDLAYKGKARLGVPEALAVLLLTWNKAHYQYHKFDNSQLNRVKALLSDHKDEIEEYRRKDIKNLSDGEMPKILPLFDAFEAVLGPVGAAKALHLLAPMLLPLWDRAIAKAHGLPLGKSGTNGSRYWKFIQISRDQCRSLASKVSSLNEPLKFIDEYNYCKYTKHWME
jgi:hypothetical protein